MKMASSIACMFSGILTIGLTYYKPYAYWNNASRRWGRRWLGDRNAALFHYASGGLLIWLGILLSFKSAG
jgi:hypothetical protein